MFIFLARVVWPGKERDSEQYGKSVSAQLEYVHGDNVDTGKSEEQQFYINTKDVSGNEAAALKSLTKGQITVAVRQPLHLKDGKSTKPYFYKLLTGRNVGTGVQEHMGKTGRAAQPNSKTERFEASAKEVAHVISTLKETLPEGFSDEATQAAAATSIIRVDNNKDVGS